MVDDGTDRTQPLYRVLRGRRNGNGRTRARLVSRRMLDHLALQVADVDAAATFYTRVFASCGVRELMRHDSPGGAVVGLCGPDNYPRLWLGSLVDDGVRPVHLAIAAPSRDAVDAVFAAAREAGRRDPARAAGVARVPPGLLRRLPPRPRRQQRRGRPPHVGSAVTAADAPWWTRAVVYQIYPRSFQDSDGDGIGDLGGVLQRLDHLSDLGVDVLWLSPVYPSPQADNGYDISDYQGIDPLFGTLEQLDELIARAAPPRDAAGDGPGREPHQRRAPVVRGEQIVAFQPKRDWYWWRPPRHGMAAGDPGAEPTNWQSFFSGPTWELDEASGEYYLHLFDRKQPDLNWENPEVRQAVYAMMRWWLDRGVDGFRMDVINMISKEVGAGRPPARRAAAARARRSATGRRTSSAVRGSTSSSHEMHREVFAGRDGLAAHGRRDARA